MADKVCLVVYFNYNYAANIPKIYKYYGERFKDIRIIIPYFRSPTDERIITVYENAWNYQGMYAQAYSRLKDGDFSHYIFVPDDLLINNGLGQDNILNALKQDQTGSFITNIETLAYSSTYGWANCTEEHTGFFTRLVEIRNEIPDPETAVKIYQQQKEFEDIEFNSFIDYQAVTKFGKVISSIYTVGFKKVFKRKYKKIPVKYLPKKREQLPYPLLMGFADLLVINASDLEQFCHLCGIFASMKMFSQIAVPTALALSNSHIVTINDIDFSRKVYWDQERITDLAALKKECQGSVKNLFSGDRSMVLYFHPIKLSGWEVD